MGRSPLSVALCSRLRPYLLPPPRWTSFLIPVRPVGLSALPSSIHQRTDAAGAIGGDRLAVPHAHDLGVDLGQAAEGGAVLLQVQVERRPAGAELRPGSDRIAG